jgi:hypothetical protein
MKVLSFGSAGGGLRRTDVEKFEDDRFVARPCGRELQPMPIHSRRNLPLSRHLPVASTEGKLTTNLNKTGCGCGTDRSFITTLVEQCDSLLICRLISSGLSSGRAGEMFVDAGEYAIVLGAAIRPGSGL